MTSGASPAAWLHIFQAPLVHLYADIGPETLGKIQAGPWMPWAADISGLEALGFYVMNAGDATHSDVGRFNDLLEI